MLEDGGSKVGGLFGPLVYRVGVARDGVRGRALLLSDLFPYFVHEREAVTRGRPI